MVMFDGLEPIWFNVGKMCKSHLFTMSNRSLFFVIRFTVLNPLDEIRGKEGS